MPNHRGWFLLLNLLAFTAFSDKVAADTSSILIRNGQKVGFLGDSITQQGAGPLGYITLVTDGLKTEGIEITPIKAGVPGHTSGNMKSRVDHDVLSQGAEWMTLSCGVNDIAMQKKGHGNDLEKYKANVTAILDQAKAKNVQVIILTATPIGEDSASPENQMQTGYNQFLRDQAKERNLPLADVNAVFWEEIKAHPGPIGTPGTYNQGRLLADGLHPNKDGQKIMAETVLLAMGVPKEDFPRIEAVWPKGPPPKVKGGSATPTPQPPPAPAAP